MSVIINEDKRYISTSAVNRILELVHAKLQEKQNALSQAQLDAIDSVSGKLDIETFDSISGNFATKDDLDDYQKKLTFDYTDF